MTTHGISSVTLLAFVLDLLFRQIEFIDIENYFAGFKFQSKAFTTKEIRYWKITYLDDDFRVLRARRPETDEKESFIFVFIRDEAARNQ